MLGIPRIGHTKEGLFGDLFGSSNHSQSTTSTSNVTNTQLAGGDISGVATYGSGNNISYTQVATDDGAVAASLLSSNDIATKALYSGSVAALSANQLSGQALLAATDVSHAALELGATEASTGAAVAIAGLNHASDAYTSSLALVGDVTQNSLNNNATVAQYAIASANGATDSVGQFAGKALDSVTRFSGAALDDNTYIAGKSLDSVSAAYSASLSTVQNTNAQALSTIQNGFTGALDQVNALAQQVSQSATQTTDDTVQKIVLYIAIAAGFYFISRRG